eukprot:gene3654-4552_t
MENDKVELSRRYSGGGAVYQDLGNSNFTFISPTKQYDKNRNTKIIIDALKSLGMPNPEASGRNDILIQGKKVSGSAYKQSGPRSFHHGTLMIDVDMNALQKYLNPNKEKLKSKGITSVISRVLNMRTIEPKLNHDIICQSIVDSFLKTYNNNDEGSSQPTISIEELNTSDLERIPSLKETYDSLCNWEWRYGRTPPFEHEFEIRFDWGIIDIYMDCKSGVIENVQIFSDSLFPAMIASVTDSLKGAKYSSEGISKALDSVKETFKSTECESQVEQLKQWLITKI